MSAVSINKYLKMSTIVIQRLVWLFIQTERTTRTFPDERKVSKIQTTRLLLNQTNRNSSGSVRRVVPDLTTGGTVVWWSTRMGWCMEQRAQRGDCWQSSVFFFLSWKNYSDYTHAADIHCSLFKAPAGCKTRFLFKQHQDSRSGRFLVWNHRGCPSKTERERKDFRRGKGKQELGEIVSGCSLKGLAGGGVW